MNKLQSDILDTIVKYAPSTPATEAYALAIEMEKIVLGIVSDTVDEVHRLRAAVVYTDKSAYNRGKIDRSEGQTK